MIHNAYSEYSFLHDQDKLVDKILKTSIVEKKFHRDFPWVQNLMAVSVDSQI